MATLGAPPISVVIASLVGAPFIDDCLHSLEAEAHELGAEILVVACGTGKYADRIRQSFPWTRVIHVQERETVPQLRRRGVESARARIVAIIEEHLVAEADWLRFALAPFQRPECTAVAGPVAHDSYRRLRDWVVYFIEYNGLMPPSPEGRVDRLNSANVAYRRDVLLQNLKALEEGYWEITLHPALTANGAEFFSVPQMSARHRGPFSYGYYLHQRYLFSRAFAGWRARSLSPTYRFLYLATAPIVPFILFLRMAQRISAKGGVTDKFLLAAPLILPALFVYVAGEWMGYAAGPGDALYRVE
jgi:hypothetical protein